MNIAIGNSIGYSNNANKVAGLFQYLLNDTFTTDRAAGAVNGTAAEPGPGLRTVVDTGNQLTLSSGNLAISGGASSWGSPNLHYQIPQRTPGRLMIVEVNFTNKLFAVIGWTNNSTGLGSSTHSIQFYFRDVLRFWGGDISYNYGAYNTGSAYQVALIQRSVGGYLFIKNYTGAYWTLLEIMHSGTAVCNPQINSFNASMTTSYIRIPTGLWLPTPSASDGFSVWGTTDGLGHAEGITGGLGIGGSGLTWTQNVGTWVATSGTANASALSGSLAIATVETNTADVIASVKLTRNGGNGSVIVRFADTSNFVRASHTGTNAQLIKRIAGTETTLIDTVATYVANAELRVTCEGTKFRLYYNNALISTEQTIADAGVATATKQGLRTTDTANTFDNFTVYARGSGGEYVALDNY